MYTYIRCNFYLKKLKCTIPARTNPANKKYIPITLDINPKRVNPIKARIPAKITSKCFMV